MRSTGMNRACGDVCGLVPISSHLLMLNLAGTPDTCGLDGGADGTVRSGHSHGRGRAGGLCA